MSRFQLTDIHQMALLRRRVAQLKEAESQREHLKAQEQARLLESQTAEVVARSRQIEAVPAKLDTEAARRAFRQRLADLRNSLTNRRDHAREAELAAHEALRLARIAHARMSAREETIDEQCRSDRRSSDRVAENRAYELTVETTVSGRHVRDAR